MRPVKQTQLSERRRETETLELETHTLVPHLWMPILGLLSGDAIVLHFRSLILYACYCTRQTARDTAALAAVEQMIRKEQTGEREHGNKGPRTRLHLDIMFISCMRTIWGNITGCYKWSPMVNWLHDVLSVPRCQLRSFWRPADAKRKHIRFPCWIHYSGPSINIVLLVVPGVLLPPAHQLWLSQHCDRVCVGLSRKRRASAARFRSKFLWTRAVNFKVNTLSNARMWEDF